MSGRSDDQLFDLGLDGGGEDEVNYERGTEILPEPPHLHSQNRGSSIHGSHASVVGGRASSPKLFAQAALFPECSQLRAWKMENGQPVGIGVIEAEASEEDFVRRFSSAMPQSGQGKATFRMRPVGLDGRELGQEFSLLISEHHEALRSSSSSSEIGIGGGSGVPSQMIDMLRETLTASQSALEAERARTQELLQQMAQERIDLASNATTSVQAISERMLEADAARHEQILRSEQQRNSQSQNSMSQFFKSNLEVLQTERDRSEQLYQQQQDKDRLFHQTILEQERIKRERDQEESRNRVTMMESQQERERLRQAEHFTMMIEQERQRRERDAQEFRERMELLRLQNEHKRTQEKEEYERKERDRRRNSEEKRDRDRRDQKEREAERNRLHQMKLKELDLQAQRDREHQERMMSLQTLQAQKEAGVGIKETLKEGMEMLQNFGIEPTELIQKLLGNQEDNSTGSEIIGSITKIAGNFADVAKAHVHAQAKVQTAKQRNPAPSPKPRLSRRQIEEMDDLDDFYMEEEEFEDMEFAEPPQKITPSSSAPPPSPSPPPPDQPQLNLPLKTQKDARKAMRKLVDQLKRIKSKPMQWEEKIALAITNEPAIYHYCEARGTLGALKEAGADPVFSANIIDLLDQSSLVPANFNFGE